MIGVVGVTDRCIIFAEVEAADRAVVEQEPRAQAMRALPPWKLQYSRQKAHEESAVADEDDVFFGLSFFVTMFCY